MYRVDNVQRMPMRMGIPPTALDLRVQNIVEHQEFVTNLLTVDIKAAATCLVCSEDRVIVFREEWIVELEGFVVGYLHSNLSVTW